MDVKKAIDLASALGDGCPAAFVCGRPPRILTSAAWRRELTRPALELWRNCCSDAVMEDGLLLGYPTYDAAEGTGRVLLGVFVVAPPVGPKRASLRDHLQWIARAIERLDASLVAGLFGRLQSGDPGVRRDLLRVLKHFKYNVRTCSAALGMCRETLYKYIREYDIRLHRVAAAVRAGQPLDDDDRD